MPLLKRVRGKEAEGSILYVYTLGEIKVVPETLKNVEKWTALQRKCINDMDAKNQVMWTCFSSLYGIKQ